MDSEKDISTEEKITKNQDALKSIIVVVPPLEKQNEIAKHISAIRKQAQELKDQTKLLLEKANKKIEDILLNS